MRNGQNKQRMRNRNNNNNRRGQNPMTRVYESNGPDIKIRGTASHIAEKYLQLARDARSSGDPVAAENYYQHAEHYFRLIAAAQEQFRQNQPQAQPRNEEMLQDDGDYEGENFSSFGQEPGFVPTQQPQPYQRDQQQPRDVRDRDRDREHRPQSQYQPQPQPAIPDSGGVDRLPSFITGSQPQINGGGGGYEGNGGGGDRDRDRFPRRRRRPHGGPRHENVGQSQSSNPGEDFNPGNE